MKNRKLAVVIGVVALVVIIVAARIVYTQLGNDYKTVDLVVTDSSQSAQIADFTVVDAEGTQLSLSQCIGTPVVVNFWASWCPPCKYEMPHFESVYSQHPGTRFLMVNMTLSNNETLEDAQSLINDAGYTFDVYYDTEGEAMRAYSVSSLPTTLFIDANGQIAAYAIGVISQETLEEGLAIIEGADSGATS